MQNWNQWQLSAGAVTTPVPQPPVGYPAPAGADPTAMMQNYMQYYNQPAPSGYTSEQWAATQQQGWTQWQQWQQQYQQWQAQYGDKYQETMKQHLTAQNMNLTGQMQMSQNVQPPPLPKEDARPPLPPATTNIYQFANMPPPHQNNLPLFPTKEPANKITSQAVTNYPVNPPLPTSQPPLPPEIGQNRENILPEKCDSNVFSESNSAKKLKPEDDDLTEAEKTFDAQFKQWEEEFNKWKQQNANHPDKTQYKQYEAKWTSWREKLIERREQMRKKREQQKQTAAKAQAEKNKNISGDDKILNILSNTENQGLINHLLGIGKTLGLTGKQSGTTSLAPPPPPPPPLPENTTSNNQSAIHGTQQMTQANIRPNVVDPSWSNQQQPWGNQLYNPRMEAPPGYGPPMSTIPSMAPAQDIGSSQIISPNFTQPPPNLLNHAVPNFSQPPPNFSSNDRPQLQNVRAPASNDRPPFGLPDSSNTDMRFMPNFRKNDQEQDNPNANEQDQFQSTDTDRMEAQPFRRGDKNYNDFGNNQLNQQNNFNSPNDRFGPTNDRFGSGNDRFRDNNRFGSVGNDRFVSGGDRFGSNNDRPGPGSDRFGNEWFGSEGDRFRARMDKDRRGPGTDRFGPDNERFGTNRPPPGFGASGGSGGPNLGTDRFDSKDNFFPGNDRFGPNGEHFRPNDRFGRGNTDYFDTKDGIDHRRDTFGPNLRGFNRNSPFSPSNDLPPELKKLMEKRKAAGDVFRPSFVDSDKSTSVGSLSESFKKIAGDSPFKSSYDFPKNPPNRGGLSNFSGSSNLQPHSSSDLGQISSFGLRGQPFNRDNEPPFRGPPENFIKPNPTEYNDRLGKNIEIRPHLDQSQTINIPPQTSIEHPGNAETADSTSLLHTDNIVEATNEIVTSANDADNIVRQDNSIVSADILEKKDDKEEERKALGDDNSLQQDNKSYDNDQIQSDAKNTEIQPEIIELDNDNDNTIKKSESLPFMGENDPRPEDLNIEPPPELPNLHPITTDSGPNAPFNSNESFDRKVPAGDQFNMRFDNSFSPRGMEFKPGMPFGHREPPMFSPRGPQTFPMGPPPNVFQLQNSMNLQLGPRGPNDQFRPNISNESQFSPRKANDEQDHNDESLGASKSGQFGPRDSMNEKFAQFGPRAPGKFGLSGPVGLRGPPDSSFAPRNFSSFGFRGNTMPFGPRGTNDRMDSRPIRPFGPRGPNDASCGPRGPNDGPYGPRGPSDTSFGKRGPMDSQFGPMGPNRFGRMNEPPFDKRPPFDNNGSFGFPGERSPAFRRPSEGPPGPRGPNDLSLGPRDSSDPLLPRKNFNENRFEPRDNNDGPFGSPDFKTRSPMGDQNNMNLPPWGDNLNRGDYLRKNPCVRREQFEDNMSAKKPRFENQGEEFGKSGPDRNIDMEMQKDNVDEHAASLPDLQKKESEAAPHPGWTDKFGNDQKTDADQFDADRNISNTESIAIEPKVGDLRPRYSDPAGGSDSQSKYTPNLFMKRSQLRDDQEFCVQKQFNYNHGEIDKKSIENFTPTKVIDYAHKFRPSPVDQHLSPVQCFDYGHGNLKQPMILEHEEQQQQELPRRDLTERNWAESDQNAKEYTEQIKNKYENPRGYTEKTRNYATNYDMRRPMDYNKRKEYDWHPSDKKSEMEWKENDDRKERGYPESESRFFERDSGNDQNGKERVQEIRESFRDETNNDNDDSRSKGNVIWQENSNKSVVDTNLQETSLHPDTKKNVAESTTKTLDLAKIPNCTMVDDLLCLPGRQNRPPKIAVILRGPPGSGKSFVAKLIKDKEVEQGGSAPRILSLDDYFLVEKEIESKDDNGKRITIKEMIYEYEEAMEQSYVTSLVKAFKKNITDGFFNFIILDCINEKISDYEEMWSFAKTKGFKVYVCEMEMDLQICLKRNIHNRTEDEINRIIDYFEPTPSYHQKLDVNSMLQDQAIEEVNMEDSQTLERSIAQNEDSEDSHEDAQEGVSKWERMEAEDKLDRLDGLAKKKHEKPQTMEDFLQVPDYYNMEDTSGKKRVRWADLEERKEQEKMRAVGFVVGHTNWDRMMDPTKGGSALTRTKLFSLS